MAFTDHSIQAFVFPQDGGTGTSDANADWTNAAYIGGLAQAEASNYAPHGLNVTPDYAADSFSLSEGVAYIRDTRSVTFRTDADNEENRSGTWNVGFLAFIMVPPGNVSGIALEATTGRNWVWIGYNHNGQNDVFVRVADTSSDAPANGALLLATIDAGTQTVTELNRVAGLAWSFAGFDNFTTMQSEVTTTLSSTFDEVVLKPYLVEGTSTSTAILYMQVNGVTSGYKFRTTQGNSSGTKIKMAQLNPSKGNIAGNIHMTGRFPQNAAGNRVWSFDNGLAGDTAKQYSFSGNNDGMPSSDLTSATFWWSSGDIRGYFEWWGRNYVGR